MKINKDYEIYVEQCVGEVSVGWRWYSKEPTLVKKYEYVGDFAGADVLDYCSVPAEVLKALEVLKRVEV